MKTLFSIVLALIVITARSQVTIQWGQTQMISKTTLTLQVVVNPPMRRGTPIHDSIFTALQALGCDYVRFVPWLPYPRLGVAELKENVWDFSVIDPITLDFLEATKGHSVILNFSTIPAWMYKTAQPVAYPDDPYAVFWDYTQGNVPRDTTYGEIARYYARLYSWYTKGGFTDETGARHGSGHHYAVPYWEVLNEVDFEHGNTAQSYTRLYDAVTGAIKKISPGTKFVAMALADPNRPEWFEYFLDRKHHKDGVPLDMISYHFYATGNAHQVGDVLQYTFWERADGFLNTVKFIESIRKRLSPATKTTIDELGSILDNDNTVPDRDPIPDDYWNLSGALYAYTYLGLAHQGIDVVGESQLVGYPTQYPSVSMINWKTGRPNARYWVLKLLKDNFGPGDTFVNSAGAPDAITLQAVATAKGRRLLLINKRDKLVRLVLPKEFDGGWLHVVDTSTGDEKPAEIPITGAAIELKPFAVAVAGAHFLDTSRKAIAGIPAAFRKKREK
ncbi:glycosyl hydrolase family 39 [Dinghuibacter silviterrae]|nr:glycosyl hydrolase family 39 [Dinghuibacter silviterrae]